MDGGDVIVRSAIAGSTIAYAWGECCSHRAHQLARTGTYCLDAGAALCARTSRPRFMSATAGATHTLPRYRAANAALTGLEWGGGLGSITISCRVGR